MEAARTHEELRAELISKAAADDGFRAALVQDPRATIKEALNLDLPESVTVHVHEETASAAHLVLPPNSGLTETDLEGISAGHTHTTDVYGTHEVPAGHTHDANNMIGYFLDDTHYNGDESGEHEHIPLA